MDQAEPGMASGQEERENTMISERTYDLAVNLNRARNSRASDFYLEYDRGPRGGTSQASLKRLGERRRTALIERLSAELAASEAQDQRCALEAEANRQTNAAAQREATIADALRWLGSLELWGQRTAEDLAAARGQTAAEWAKRNQYRRGHPYLGGEAGQRAWRDADTAALASGDPTYLSKIEGEKSDWEAALARDVERFAAEAADVRARLVAAGVLSEGEPARA